MYNLHALSKILYFFFSVDLRNGLILEHYMVLSFEMAAKEQVPQKSIQLISIHLDALSFTLVDVLFQGDESQTKDQLSTFCSIPLPTHISKRISEFF